MKKIEHFMLPEHTNQLYKKEAASSLALTRDVADKINELIDAYNHFSSDDLEWKLEQEGRIRKGVLFMKDNLLNSIHDLFTLMSNTGELQSIIDAIYSSQVDKNTELLEMLKIFSSPQMFGAKGDGKTDDTYAIQRAIETSNFVYFPAGVYCFKTLKVKSGTYMVGNNTTLKCLDGSTSENTGAISAEFSSGVLENVIIDGFIFDGDKENISGEYYDIIGLFALGSERIENVRILNCHFRQFREDAIRFMFSKSATVRNIMIRDCIFDGVSNDIPSMNAIRFVIDNYVDSYGTYPASNISIVNCSAFMCRTLADIKRGCRNVIVSNCFTHNMNDCHNSVDGSKDVILLNLISSMDADFVPTTGTNFLEVQGENISVVNLIGDGAGVVRDGVQVTDYGHPDENGVGHLSKFVSFNGCKVSNLSRNGFNVVNGYNVRISNCSVENAAAHSYAFTNGEGRKDSSGNKLSGGLNYCSTCLHLNCAYGVTAKNTANDDIILHLSDVKNEKGFLPIYNTEQIMIVPKLKIVESNPLNLNSEMLLSGGELQHYTLSNVTCEAAADIPTGKYAAVKIIDDNSSKLGECQCSVRFPAKIGERFTFIVNGKKTGENIYFSILIKEYSGTEWVANTFISSQSLGADWTEFLGQCEIQNAATDNIHVCLVPASSYNNPGAVGSIAISDFKVMKV